MPALTGALLVLSLTCALAADEPLKGHWRYFPVAFGAPEEPLPPKEELLKVVPPLRETPTLSTEAQSLGLALWWADYSRLLFCEQPPSADDLARKPAIRTSPGEDEPLVLALWSISHTGSVTLSVKESPFPLTIRSVEFAPRYLPTPYRDVEVEGGRVVGFATYMPEAGMGEVKPGENTVFWINVAVPRDASPGKHPIALELIVHQVKVLEIEASVEVLPFALPRANVAFGMYYRWAGPKDDARYRKPELLRMYWRDMARHGMTSATHYMYTASGDWIDKEGHVKPLDGHESLRQLEDMRDEGLISADVPIMLLSTNLGKFPDAAGIIQEEFKKRALPELLLYGRDEPSVNDEARASFEALQPVRPHMRITTAINDYAATAYADLIDVWVVNAGRITPELRSLAKEKGAELWTYDCNHRGRGNGTRARFYAGLYTWALNLRGNFHWCYTEGYSWEGNRNATFNFVLPSDSGPVPSVAWENRREGVEDYRLLRLLESRIAAHADRPEARQAQAWLNQLRSRVNWDLIQGMPKSVYPWDGAEVYPMCPDFEPAELSQIRSRIVDFVLALL
ncbi:MAG: glycoside hydrolase domain-containing protein [Planctomycetota bacterium]